MKMTEYSAISSLVEDNILLTDGGSDGTKKIKVVDAFLAMMHLVSPENHRRIFRGKNLGSTVTNAQLTAIQNGTFEDLWLGDYWEINDVKWRIVDFDYFYGKGDSAEGYYTDHKRHHLVIMPDTAIETRAMDTSGKATAGYNACTYRSNYKDNNVKPIVVEAFGNLMYSHREFISSVVANGYPTNGTWTWCDVELPNEIMMYGCCIFTSMNTGSNNPQLFTANYTQLALFEVAPEYIISPGVNQWLRDVVSDTQYAMILRSGNANRATASSTNGIRPYFLIG